MKHLIDVKERLGKTLLSDRIGSNEKLFKNLGYLYDEGDTVLLTMRLLWPSWKGKG